MGGIRLADDCNRFKVQNGHPAKTAILIILRSNLEVYDIASGIVIDGNFRIPPGEEASIAIEEKNVKISVLIENKSNLYSLPVKESVDATMYQNCTLEKEDFEYLEEDAILVRLQKEKDDTVILESV